MWFVLSLLAGFLFAANRLVVRSVLIKKVNPMVFGAVHEVLAGLLLLPLGLVYFSLPQSPKTWIALLLGVFFIFLTDLFSFLSLRNIEASLFQIINQLRHIIVLIGASFFFLEAISLTKVAAILLIMFGITVALISKSKLDMGRGILYAFLSTITISFGLLFIKMASVDVAPVFSGALAFLSSGFMIYVLLFVRGEMPKTFMPSGYRKELFIAATLFAFFTIALFTALAIDEASKVIPVTQSSMIFTVIGGYMFLHEKNHMKQKIIGSALIVVGIALLYLI